MQPRVCLIGLDSAPPELVFDRWLDDLPNLRALTRTGTWGPLESTVPPITVPAWMSMMTGRDPGTLGIYGFRNRKDHSYDALEFAGSHMVREPAVWDILGARGKRSILLGVPLTFPPRPLNGLLVGDFLAPSTQSDYTYPPELKDEIREAVGDYIIDVRNFRTDDKAALLADVRQMTRTRFALARHLLTQHPWDLFAMVEMGPDRIQHGFWRFFDELHHLHEPGNAFAGAIRDYYVELDALVGGLIDLLPDGTLTVVVSDHGARRMEGGICFNEWLVREGYLTLKEAPKPGTRFSPALVDWSRTRAWGDGGYYGRLFLNVQGREPEGVVPPDQYDAVRSEIAARLEALGDEEGRPIGTRVFRPEDLYASVNRVAPDLIVYFGNLSWRSVGSLGHGSVWTRANDTGPDDANHAQYGIALAARKGVDAVGRRREGMSLYDIAPTILREFGIEPPAGMGRSALQVPADEPVYTPEEEAEIARRLEDLGYI